MFPHKEYNALFQATIPLRYIFRKEHISLVGLFWSETNWLACFGQMEKVYP